MPVMTGDSKEVEAACILMTGDSKEVEAACILGKVFRAPPEVLEVRCSRVR